MAATLLKDAQCNRFLNFKPDEISHRLYTLYYNPVLKWLQYLAVLMVLALAMLEKPSMWPDVPFWVGNAFSIFSVMVSTICKSCSHFVLYDFSARNHKM